MQTDKFITKNRFLLPIGYNDLTYIAIEIKGFGRFGLLFTFFIVSKKKLNILVVQTA